MLGIRLKIMLAVFAVGLIISGFVGLGERIRYPNPKTESAAQVVKDLPDAGWYRVTGGYLDLANAQLGLGSDRDAYFVPLFPDGVPPESSIQIVVKVSDDATVHQIDAYCDAAKKPTTMWALTHQAEVGKLPATPFIAATFSGMVNESGATSAKETIWLENGFGNNNLTIIDKDNHPNALLALAQIFGGVVLSILSLMSFGIHLDPAAIKEHFQSRKESRAPDLLGQNADGTPHPTYTYGVGQTAPQQPPAYPPPPYTQPAAGYSQQTETPQGQHSVPPSFTQPAQPAGLRDYPLPPMTPAPTSPPAGQQVLEAAIPQSSVAVAPSEVTPKASKADEELARLKEIKAFDPFAD